MRQLICRVHEKTTINDSVIAKLQEHLLRAQLRQLTFYLIWPKLGQYTLKNAWQLRNKDQKAGNGARNASRLIEKILGQKILESGGAWINNMTDHGIQVDKEDDIVKTEAWYLLQGK